MLALLGAPPGVAAARPGVETPSQGEPPFVELADSGIDFVHTTGRAGHFLFPEITCAGVALLDYDGDGDLDLYLVQGGPLEATGGGGPAPSDRLYRNDLRSVPDGRPLVRFTDVTAEAGVADSGFGCGVATGDYDNDGWTDLYVTGFGANRLLHNRGRDGAGRVSFEDVTTAAGADDPRWSVSASFADYDGDGWLDLYVTNYLDFTVATSKACRTPAGAPDYCNPASYAGVPDLLLHNRGRGADGRVSFADVSTASGIAAVRSKSLGVVAADVDGDGRTDFYVTDDGTPNQLWVQGEDGRFADRALGAGCAVNGRGQAEASMGVAAEDDDGDGDLDLLATHLTGETHTLWRADGAGGFVDATTAAGLAVPSVAMTGWGVAWVDYDNDGWSDLAVVDGAVRTLQPLADAGEPFPFAQPNQLYHNRGGEGEPGRYAEVAAGPAFERAEVSRALAAGDLDGDGDLDLVVANADGPPRVLINRLGQRAHWLGLRLVGGADEGPLRDQLGAGVKLLRSGRPTVLRRSHTDGSFAAASDPRVLFGLGSEASPQAVEVRWPSGRVERFSGLAADRYTTLREGAGTAEPAASPGLAGRAGTAAGDARSGSGTVRSSDPGST